MLKFLVLNVITWGWFMKFSQKAKYFIYGVVAVGVLVPLAIKAVDTIPLTFNKGDVVSAGVMNNLFTRINAATNPIVSSDLIGTWTVTQVVPYTGQPGNGGCRGNNTCNITGTTDAADGMSRSRTDTVTISQNGATLNYSQAAVASFVQSWTNSAESGTVSILAETAIFKSGGGYSYFYVKKKSANRIVLQDIEPGSNSFNMVILDKQNTVPLPVTTLAIAYANGSATLTWTDANADNTGYIVQRSVDSGTTWTTINTITSAATLTYTDTGLTTGTTYQYQVIATNANGNSIGSSVVQAAL